MSSGTQTLLEVGRVIGCHGLRGDIKVRVTQLAPEELLAAETIYLQQKAGAAEPMRPLRQSVHKGNVLLRFAGYESLTAVEPLIGARILLSEEQLPEPDDGLDYFHRLVGMQVVDRQLGEIGELVEMFTTAAHDTYVVQGRFGEVLIPAVAEFIAEIDQERRVVHVDLPEGLVFVNQ